MSQATELDTTAIVTRYLAVWNEPDPAVRRAAIEEIWLPDATEFVHEAHHHGYAELEARVNSPYQAFVASGKYSIEGAGDVTRHDDIVMFTVQLVTPEGTVDFATRVFLLLADDGRIREDYQLTVKPLPA
jgi:hypothetical protein